MATTADSSDGYFRLAGEVERLRVALRKDTSHELLSFRKAAKLLGLDRTKTLPLLIASGQLRCVYVGKRQRIPMAEVRRLLIDETAWKLKI